MSTVNQTNVFGSERVLLYAVDPWDTLGFGVPNFQDKVGSLSTPIANLVDEVGRQQLYIMTHVDAMRMQPPSINTLIRLGKMINRMQAVFMARQKTDQDQRLETIHVSPAPIVFNVHPVPFFNSPVLRNHWLFEYNELCMYALSNMMQHSDNNVPLVITAKFAGDIWSFFREMKIRMCTELLGLDAAVVGQDSFVFTFPLPPWAAGATPPGTVGTDSFAKFAASSVTTNMEAMDTPGNVFQLPTENDLRPFFNGIPANLIAPCLKQYAVTGAADFSGTQPAPGSGAVGASGPNAATATGTIGNASI